MERTEPNPWLPPASVPPPAYEAPEAPRPPYEEQRKSLGQRLLGPIVAAGVVLAKFGKVALLLLTKAKFLTTSGSMLVSIAAYSLIWGWKFAAGFVALLFVHEMGHYIQMRREGVQAELDGVHPVPRRRGRRALARRLRARRGARRPRRPGARHARHASSSAGIYLATGEEFWRALAFVGFFLNLFNLLPVLPLDGGRAMAAMAPWMWVVGFGALLALLFVAPNPILIFILLFGGMETWRRYKQRKAGLEGNAAYYKVKPIHRLAVGAVYVGLLVLLGVGMDLTHLERTFSDV